MREALTDKGKKFLTGPELEKLSRKQGRRDRELIVVDNLAWRRHGKGMRGPRELEPAEKKMLIGYLDKPGQTLSPRAALGRPGSSASALTIFKRMRQKVDVMRKRLDWELLKVAPGDSPSQVRFTFVAPRGFRYIVTRPYSPEDLPELRIRVASGFYELSPATGVFVEVKLEELSDEVLTIYDAWLEILQVPAVRPEARPRLKISRLIHDAMPEALLPAPPFQLGRREIISSVWAFDLTDEKEQLIPAEKITKAFLCLRAGPSRQVARYPVDIQRRRYRRSKAAP